jgi:hypothetical protein
MTSPSSAGRWPRLLLLLGLCFLALSGWGVRQALTGASAVGDLRYDEQSRHHVRSLGEQQAADALGWRLDLAVRQGRLEARLRDNTGRPVGGGKAVLRLSGMTPPLTLVLAERPDGLYSAELPAGLHGEVGALLILERSGAGLRRQLLLHL